MEHRNTQAQRRRREPAPNITGGAINIMLRPTKEEGAQIRQAAADAGQSVQGYVLGAVRVQMDKDKGGQSVVYDRVDASSGESLCRTMAEECDTAIFCIFHR